MRNSERVSFRRCGFKWDLSYNRRLEPTRSRPALTFGTLIHASLEPWYPPGVKRGIHPAETFAKLYSELDDPFTIFDDEGERVSAYDMGMAMCEGYVEQWGEEPHIEVIAPEQSMEIDIFDRQGNYLCTWVGQGDLLIRNLKTERLGWYEHKTSKEHVEEVPVNSQYGDQGVAYAWAGAHWMKHHGIMAEDDFVDSVTYNFLRKTVPDSRPRSPQGHYLNKPSKDALKAACVREGLSDKGTIAALSDRLEEAGWSVEQIEQLGEPSKNQPSPRYSRFRMDLFPQHLVNFDKRVRQEAWMMAQVRAGKAPVIKNPTRDCRWECDFRDACELHEMGGDWELVLEYDFTEWNPYDNHLILQEK